MDCVRALVPIPTVMLVMMPASLLTSPSGTTSGTVES